MATKPSFGERLLVAVVVILAVITWPFVALARMLGRLAPGWREREARDAQGISENSAQNAAQIIAALAPDRPDMVVDAEDGDPWNAAIDALRGAARIGVIDWRSEPDELREALEPMLARHGATLDWSFVDDLTAREDWGALNNEKLVPRVAREVEKLGLVLAQIDEGSDAYLMAVVTPDAFAKIDGMRMDRGIIRIGRFR